MEGVLQMKKLKQLLLILTLSISLTAPSTLPGIGTTEAVSAATVKKPSLSSSKISVYSGKSVTLKVKGTSGKIKWSSQNKRIAVVNSKGKITGKAAGKTIIYAKTGKYTLQCQITVKAKRSSKPQIQSSVWIPATGKKYHRIPNCGNMNPNRARKVTLSQAKQRGYTACKKCYR